MQPSVQSHSLLTNHACRVMHLLPDDLLKPLLLNAVHPFPVAEYTRHSRQHVQATNTAALSALSLTCRRFRAILQRVPISMLVDGRRAAGQLHRFASQQKGSQPRLCSIKISFDGQYSRCRCVHRQWVRSLSLLGPTLTVLDLDSISPCQQVMRELGNSALRSCTGLTSVRFTRWRVPVEIFSVDSPLGGIANDLANAFKQLLRALPASVRTFVLTGMYADALSRAAMAIAQASWVAEAAQALAQTRVKQVFLSDAIPTPLALKVSHLQGLSLLRALVLHDVFITDLYLLPPTLLGGSPFLVKFGLRLTPGHDSSDVRHFIANMPLMHQLQHIHLQALSLDSDATAEIADVVSPSLRQLVVEATALSDRAIQKIWERVESMDPAPQVALRACRRCSTCAPRAR
eukprot:2653281-Rhodomonas_salina.7